MATDLRGHLRAITRLGPTGVILVTTLMAGCGSGGGGGGETAPAMYAIGGTVTGLGGSGLVLANNGGDSLAVSANGSFTFGTSIASGSAYDITVLSQPTNPPQTCTVGNGAATATVNVTTVVVTCITNPSAAVELVVNGSFEANNFFVERSGFPRLDDVNGSSPTGWTRDSGTLAEYMRSSPAYLGVTIYNAAHGDYFIGPHDGEWWEQTFATIPGTHYKLTYSSAYGAAWSSSFYYRPGTTPGLVTLNGNTTLFTGPLAGTAAAPSGTTLLDSPFVWSAHTVNFTADSNSTTLRFAGPAVADGGYVFVDAVSVVAAVP